MRLAGFPKGLLSLLQSQSFGQNPKELADIVSPTVELADLYLLSTQECIQFTWNPPGAGFNTGAGLTVPAGEVWRLHGCRVAAINGVGQTQSVSPSLFINGFTLHLSNLFVAVASQNRIQVQQLAPMWLPAGSQLGATVEDLTGTPILNGAYLVSKLKA